MKEYIVKVFDKQTLWYNKDHYLHREEGPAIECTNGDREYWINGKLHREDGPAQVFKDGSKFWYLNGVPYSEEAYLKQVNKKSCDGKIVEIDGKKYLLTEIK